MHTTYVVCLRVGLIELKAKAAATSSAVAKRMHDPLVECGQCPC
jgi:hypothetical protein